MVVLANSIMLVCIAFDRYMAVVRIVKGSWEPSKLFCIACCTIIWGFSAAVSSPLLAIYQHYKIYIVPVPENLREGDELTYYVGYLCGSDKVNRNSDSSVKLGLSSYAYLLAFRTKMDITLPSFRLSFLGRCSSLSYG
jgi:hypothetical protein